MAIVKVLAPLTLQLLWCMFLIGMARLIRAISWTAGWSSAYGGAWLWPATSSSASPPSPPGSLLFLASKVDDPGPWRKLLALYLLGAGLSAASSVLAIVALAFELYCVDACWPWVVLASVPVAAVHLVYVWFSVTGH